MDAKYILDPIDARRDDPLYKAGFNDAAASSRASTAAANGAQSATVSTVNLNLRTGPGPGFPSVATLPEGTKVRIVSDAQDGWQKLEVPRSGG